MAEPTCAAISRAAGEPLAGTASRVRGWVLLQHQGPWGADALTGSRLDRDFAQALAARAQRAGVRVVLLRRPGRGASASTPRCYLAHTGPRARFVEERVLDHPDDLLAADLEGLRGGTRPRFGRLVEGPLYLVCTNGKHDRCCATYGRPLAAALAASYDEQVWECSHIGGDRFAANLVCFPHGLYFGGVAPADGPAIAAGYERGRIDLAHYRGRCSAPPVVQAAEHFVRQREELDHVDDLVVVGRAALAEDVVVVRFAARSGRDYRVRVRTGYAAPPRRLTCNGRPATPPTYTLVALERS